MTTTDAGHLVDRRLGPLGGHDDFGFTPGGSAGGEGTGCGKGDDSETGGAERSL